MTQVGVGFSNKKDSKEAANNACQMAISSLDKKKADFLILFTTDQYNQNDIIKGIKECAPDIPLSGCCGAGVIVNSTLSQNGIGIMAIQSTTLHFKNGILENISSNPFQKGSRIFKELTNNSGEEKVLFMMPDGLTCNIPELLDGVYESIGAEYKYAGGGSGDNLKFVKTFQFFNNKVFQDSMAYTLIESSKSIGVGIKHGWAPTGDPVLVTKVKGNTIYEIDGSPALDVYKKHLGNIVNEKNFSDYAASHPFGIVETEGEYTIRDPIDCSESDGSITCIAEVPENTIVKIMKGDKESLIASAKESALNAKEQIKGNKPSFIIVFNCVSRLLYLDDKAAKEIDTIREVFGKEIPLIGVFSFGEIGSKLGGVPIFHNKTVVVSAFCE